MEANKKIECYRAVEKSIGSVAGAVAQTVNAASHPLAKAAHFPIVPITQK